VHHQLSWVCLLLPSLWHGNSAWDHPWVWEAARRCVAPLHHESVHISIKPLLLIPTTEW
jgi:hypothetical protein